MKMQGLLNEVTLDSPISARLLIVDNDAFLRTTLRQQLEGEGFNEVFEASTLLEVFKKCSVEEEEHLEQKQKCLNQVKTKQRKEGRKEDPRSRRAVVRAFADEKSAGVRAAPRSACSSAGRRAVCGGLLRCLLPRRARQ